MPSVKLRSRTGADAGQVDLPDAVFGIEPNVPVMHQVVVAPARRQARRHAVHQDPLRGARRWRQALEAEGHRSCPCRHHPCAAVAWRRCGPGPQPRKYDQKTPKKMKRLALASALSDRAAEDKVVVVSAWDFDTRAPRTHVPRCRRWA